MLSFEEARGIVERSCTWSEVSVSDLEDALGLSLAEPLRAKYDSPRFTNSAVDGFAVRQEDLSAPPVKLRLIAEVAAGESAPASLPPGCAVRVFTGAPIPTDADCVIMQEDCEWSSGHVTIKAAGSKGQHVRKQGDEYAKGCLLADAGTVLSPPWVGMLAAEGCSRVTVRQPPTVRVVTTGNELVESAEHLAPGRIFDSNGPSIAAAARAVGIRKVSRQHSTDEPSELARCLAAGLNEAQVLVTCGGVSVGAHDLVKQTLESLGVETKVWRVSMKPGKPFYFGLKGEQLIFGLPGNPVSAMVCFQVFLRPALEKLMGRTPTAFGGNYAVIQTDAKGGAGRTEFVRGVAEGGKVSPLLEQRGSHMLSGLAKANCLIRLPADVDSLRAGDQVEITYLNWGAF